MSFVLSNSNVKRGQLLFAEFVVVVLLDCDLSIVLAFKGYEGEEFLLSVDFLLVDSLTGDGSDGSEFSFNETFNCFFVHAVCEVFDVKILLLGVSVLGSDEFVHFYSLSPELFSI